MKKTTLTPLLSLLVFPGVGHLYLKKYAIGLGLIISFSYLLISLIVEIRESTKDIIDGILTGDIPMDIPLISKMLADNQSLNSSLSIISYLLLFIWLFSAYDAYRISKKD